jgi:uncharacterized membrane protein
MAKFKISVVVNSPVETVYQAFIDPENMLKWTKDLERIEIVNGKFGEIGATMHMHYNQNGRKNVLEDTLLFLDPGKKIKSRVSGGGLIAHVESSFIPRLNETEMIMSWNGKGINIIVTIILAFLKNKIKKGAQSELEKFKELVEKYGVKFQQ